MENESWTLPMPKSVVDWANEVAQHYRVEVEALSQFSVTAVLAAMDGRTAHKVGRGLHKLQKRDAGYLRDMTPEEVSAYCENLRRVATGLTDYVRAVEARAAQEASKRLESDP